MQSLFDSAQSDEYIDWHDWQDIPDRQDIPDWHDRTTGTTGMTGTTGATARPHALHPHRIMKTLFVKYPPEFIYFVNMKRLVLNKRMKYKQLRK